MEELVFEGWHKRHVVTDLAPVITNAGSDLLVLSISEMCTRATPNLRLPLMGNPLGERSRRRPSICPASARCSISGGTSVQASIQWQ